MRGFLKSWKALNDGFVCSWHIPDHSIGRKFGGKKGYVTSLALTVDGKKLVTGHGDIYNDSDIQGVVGVWVCP
jgi:hypothetical protein